MGPQKRKTRDSSVGTPEAKPAPSTPNRVQIQRKGSMHVEQCQSLLEQSIEKIGNDAKEWFATAVANTSDMQKILTGHYALRMQDAKSLYGLVEGTLFVCGSDESHQLGDCYKTGDGRVHKRWKKLPCKTPFVKCAAGGLHSAAIDTLGRVYTWGSSDQGELGRKRDESGDKEEDSFEVYPTPITGLKPSRQSKVQVPITLEDHAAVDVACGDTFTLILTRHGTVYFCGTFKEESNMFRPMPPPDVPDDDWGKAQAPAPLGMRWAPRQLLLPGKAIKIFAGTTMAAILLEGGSLVTFGLDSSGELGRGISDEDRKSRFVEIKDERPKPVPEEIEKRFMTPKHVQFPAAYGKMVVIDVSMGIHHMMVVAHKWGEVETSVFCAGGNNYSQLGIRGTEAKKNTLTLVPYFERRFIGRVACGDFHTVCTDIFGKRCYSFGRLDHAQLGNVAKPTGKWRKNEVDYRAEPKHVHLDHSGKKNLSIVALAAGNDRTMVVTHDEENVKEQTYYGWGMNEDVGALGFGVGGEDFWYPERHRLKSDEASVLQVALGGQHSLLLVEMKDA